MKKVKKVKNEVINKSDLIALVAKHVGQTKEHTGKCIDGLVHVICKLVFEKKPVNLIKFASITTDIRQARVGHNPRTGKKIEIPAKSVVRMKPGIYLKKAAAGLKDWSGTPKPVVKKTIKKPVAKA